MKSPGQLAAHGQGQVSAVVRLVPAYSGRMLSGSQRQDGRLAPRSRIAAIAMTSAMTVGLKPRRHA
jgi:hypothetical protein